MPSDPFYKGHMEGSRKILWNAIFGPDPQRKARLDPAAYERAVDQAKRAAFDEPGWPMAIRVSVPLGDEAEVGACCEGSTPGSSSGMTATWRASASGTHAS